MLDDQDKHYSNFLAITRKRKFPPEVSIMIIIFWLLTRTLSLNSLFVYVLKLTLTPSGKKAASDSND